VRISCPRFIVGFVLARAGLTNLTKEIDHFMATKRSSSKGIRKGRAAKKGSATKKGGASKKAAATKKGSATKKGGAAKKGGATKKAAAQGASSQGKCRGWQAVQNSMPPRPPRLRVTGECTFPTPGYKVTLKEAVPQGINPRILLLRKTVTPPKGPVPQVLQTIPVSFEKKNAKTKYTEVTILPEVTTIKVKQVT
jgi:hypothetical protein